MHSIRPMNKLQQKKWSINYYLREMRELRRNNSQRSWLFYDDEMFNDKCAQKTSNSTCEERNKKEKTQTCSLRRNTRKRISNNEEHSFCKWNRKPQTRCHWYFHSSFRFFFYFQWKLNTFHEMNSKGWMQSKTHWTIYFIPTCFSSFLTVHVSQMA